MTTSEFWCTTGAALPLNARESPNAGSRDERGRNDAEEKELPRPSALPRRAARTRRRTGELGIVRKDSTFDLLQLRSGLEPELLREPASGTLIGLECVALASGAVQGQHELTDRALAQRVRSDERFELGDEVCVPACSEVRVDAIFDHGESLLLEAATGVVCETLFAQVEKRRAPPERERLGLTAFAGQALESLEVELVLFDAQQVPRIPRLEPAVPQAACAGGRPRSGGSSTPSAAASRPRGRRSACRSAPPHSHGGGGRRGAPAPCRAGSRSAVRPRRPPGDPGCGIPRQYLESTVAPLAPGA